MRCVIRGCGQEFTEDTGDEDLGVCPDCGRRIARRWRDLIFAEERRDTDDARAKFAEARLVKRAWQQANLAPMFATYEQPSDTSFVYYVPSGDHIKIGYSTNVLGRLKALRVPISELMALEIGGRKEEQARHRQFAHLRVTARWENFRRGEDLLTHIEKLRETNGLPMWLQSPRRGRNGPVTTRRVV